MIKKILSLALLAGTWTCAACYRASPRELGIHSWGYGLTSGRLVLGRPMTAGRGICEPFLDGMRTCGFREVVGADTINVATLIRHGAVYHIDIQTRSRVQHSLYERLMAIFGEPVRTTLGTKPTTWLYFQDATTCARFVLADPLDALAYAELQMWDGREEGACHFD